MWAQGGVLRWIKMKNAQNVVQGIVLGLIQNVEKRRKKMKATYETIVKNSTLDEFTEEEE